MANNPSTKLNNSIHKDAVAREKVNFPLLNEHDQPLGRQAQKRKGLLKPARQIPEESDEGHIEYKWKLCDLQGGYHRWQKLVSQMVFRFCQGEGEAIYNIGYTDNGQPVGLTYIDMLRSLANFEKIVEEAGGMIKSTQIFQGSEEKYYCANIFLTKELTAGELAIAAESLAVSGDYL